ncbi:hypothetical protein RCL1_008075 [Eukaryota sp. TZLM3-RCL]
MPEYGDKSYWVDRYNKEPNTSFDWYITYVNLKEALEPFLREDSKILVVGCGNSRLSHQLYEDGFKHVTSIDIADVVIEQMSNKYNQTAPELEWLVMDICKLDFPSETFDIVIDKGTIDALLCGQDSFDTVYRAHREIHRVLKPDSGVYINISYGHSHSRLIHFTKPGLWTDSGIEEISISKSSLGLEETHDVASNNFYIYVMKQNNLVEDN